MREVMIGGNYTAQNPTVQIFGLGTATTIDSLRIEWPAIAPGPGGQTVLLAPDPRLRASAPGATLTLLHPDIL
jgi:ASPIC and UnbV